MLNKDKLKLMTVWLLFIIALVGCGSVEKEQKPSAELEIVATDIAYNTPTLSVKVGEKVRLTLNNQGKLEHDLIIEKLPHTGNIVTEDSGNAMSEHHQHDNMVQFDLHIPAPPGKMGTVEFTPSEVGEYQFECSVEGHKAAGMVGKLIVTQ